MHAIYAIIKPVVTEKATTMETKNRYAFWVNRKATKVDIKNSIKAMYGADVATVKIMNVPAKTRQIGRRLLTKRAMMKKAIITIKGNKKLDVTKIGKEAAPKVTKK